MNKNQFIRFSGPVYAFTLFAIILAFSNYFDWDVFYGYAEVDRRAILLNHELPIWSYQLCGGAPRLADPQNFSLSPFFLLVLMLGPIWGMKILVWSLALYGFFITRKIIRLFSGNNPEEIKIDIMSLVMIFGTWYTWKITGGHLSVAFHYFSLAIFYYLIKFTYLRKIERKDHLIGASGLFLLFTGSFYHSLVFFLVPLYLSLIVYLFIKILRKEFGEWRELLQIFVVHIVMLITTAWRWLPTVWYQEEYPRTFDSNYSGVTESINPVQILKYLFVMPINGSYGPLGDTSNFQIWEYTTYGVLMFFGLFFLVRRFRKIPLLGFWTIWICISLLLMSGSWSDYSPFSLLNALFGGGLRFVGRFGLGTYWALSLIGIYGIFNLINLSKIQSRLLLLLLWMVLHFGMIHYPSALSFRYISGYNRVKSQAIDERSHMTQLRKIRPRNAVTAYTLPAAISGKGFYNCVMFLNRETVVASEDIDHFPKRETFEFIDASVNSPSLECIDKSYFTQNTIHIDKSCPSVTCTNINMANPYRDEGLVYNPTYKKFCTTDSK